MIIVQLNGGLGNQMFQYAFGKTLSTINCTELKLDLSLLLDRSIKETSFAFRNYELDIFELKVNFATEKEVNELKKRFKNPIIDKITNRLIGKKNTYFVEPFYHFSNENLSLKAPIYLEGYWQSPKYFESFSQIIKKEFKFLNNLSFSIESKSIKEQIINSNSIAIHVRRGDFILKSLHRTFGIDFYNKAIEMMYKKISNIEIFIFSDDIEWCIHNFKIAHKHYFVSKPNETVLVNDFYLMSKCKHFIISNSSFSWWAAYLSEYQKKIVIAPNQWFTDSNMNTNDLIPQSWIRI